jgi:DNA-binding beta-propeller fold protein YncE
MSNRRLSVCLAFVSLAALGCHAPNPCNPDDLENRAYIVSRDSDEVHVIDLNCLQVSGVVHTGGQALHMGEVNSDLTKFYVDSELTNETVVVDARQLSVASRIATPRHPTHLTLTRDGRLFAVMAEQDNQVLFIDTATDSIVKTLPGFYLPHFMRMSLDGNFGYVANLRGNHLTQVDLRSLSISGYIPLDGEGVPPGAAELDTEGGFADAQIDQTTGLLYAAHRSTGRVLVYDTMAQRKQGELQAGASPWIVYAEHPFAQVSRRHVVPNFGDQSASIINAQASQVLGSLPVADSESYGVNYSPLVPDQAFVMNRDKQQIAVMDTASMQPIDRIDVGGTTETASTTADGKWIVATVSSANRVVVIDAVSHQVLKTFEGVGHYPWSVTIPRGQNYCH